MTTLIEAKPEMFAQVHLDPQRTTDCGIGALAAYADFDNPYNVHLPSGYRFVDRFSGWDQVFFVTGREERFGLLLRSAANPTHYMICFRGTDSMTDDYEDVFANTTKFTPTTPSPGFPHDVYVADGFYSIYNDKGHHMPRSMREQVFALIDTHKPASLTICGHSLGSSLANLFALDLAASRPGIKLTNTTFASPRTGTKQWRNTYDHQYKLEPITFRVANFYDWVPSYPFIGDYEHVGKCFFVSFYVKDAHIPHLLSRHSMLNYQYVVSRAVFLNPQLWTGQFPDAARPGWTMLSVQPPAATMPEWAKLSHQTEQTAIDQAIACEP